MILIAILGIVSLGSYMTEGEPSHDKIENTGKQLKETSDFGNQPWVPTPRGQFMRDILFGIHPDSPRNRDAWAKSGYLQLIENSKRTTTQKPIPVSFKYDILEKSTSKSERPLLKKPTLLGLTTKRIPKHIIPATIVKDETINGSIAKSMPINANLPNRTQPRTGKVQGPMGRCSIHSVAGPNQAQPYFYYLVPLHIAQMPYFPTSAFTQAQVFPHQSLPPFVNGVYAPMQNRRPVAPLLIPYYLRPVPTDIIAMQDNRFETNAVNSNKQFKTSKGGVFTIPSLQAEIIVASETMEENEKKMTKKSGQIPTVNEPHHENISDSGNQQSTATTATDVNVKSVKHEQLVVEVQEPRTEVIQTLRNSTESFEKLPQQESTTNTVTAKIVTE